MLKISVFFSVVCLTNGLERTSADRLAAAGNRPEKSRSQILVQNRQWRPLSLIVGVSSEATLLEG
jgi:hypothetical protein